MTSSATTNTFISLTLIEAGLTTVAMAVVFGWPQIGSGFLARIERLLLPLAHRKMLSVVVVGLTAFLLRLAVIPFCPVPSPDLPDDFSFLLAADTFGHGRLTNPTPPMWMHFESLQITMQPTYTTMYFPGQGLVLAAGKALLGNPWLGILCVTALMCAAICWMLQAWLPPEWALLGGFLAVIRLGLFSYWINTFHGAGSLAALGGALVLGAYPRFKTGARTRQGLLLALGAALLVFSRPYEGFLLCLPVLLALAHWAWVGREHLPMAVLVRRSVMPLALLILAGAWMAYYDYRAFGSPLTLPYKVNRATYAIVPYFVWQKIRPEPVYRHEALQNFYSQFEPMEARLLSKPGFVKKTLIQVWSELLFVAGPALLVPLIMLRRVLLDRRIRFLAASVFILALGMSIEVYLIPHYVAPFTAVFYAIGLQAMRHLRVWKPEGRLVGRTMVRSIVVICVALGVVRLFSVPLHLVPPRRPPGFWVWAWYGPGNYGLDRLRVQSELERQPGEQLVLVRYSADHNPLNEWVYNGANIDDAKVIWAREMDPEKNLELTHYYSERNVWLVEPEKNPVTITPYPVSSLGSVLSSLRSEETRQLPKSAGSLHRPF